MTTSTTNIRRIPQGVTGTVAVAQSLLNYNIAISPDVGLSLSNGTGEGQVSQYCEQQLVIPPSGADTINLNTGAVTGSQTITLTKPDNLTFALTTGLKYAEFYLQPGAVSVTLSPGTATGFVGWMGGTTPSTPIRGSSTAGIGGNFRVVGGDSIGFAVSASLRNLVITNNDGSASATVNMYLAGN